MGTVNYLTSDIITLVYDGHFANVDFIKDVLTDYGEEYPREDVEQYQIDEYLDECIRDSYNLIESRLNDVDTFDFFKIKVDYGYYDTAIKELKKRIRKEVVTA